MAEVRTRAENAQILVTPLAPLAAIDEINLLTAQGKGVLYVLADHLERQDCTEEAPALWAVRGLMEQIERVAVSALDACRAAPFASEPATPSPAVPGSELFYVEVFDVEEFQVSLASPNPLPANEAVALGRSLVAGDNSFTEYRFIPATSTEGSNHA